MFVFTDYLDPPTTTTRRPPIPPETIDCGSQATDKNHRLWRENVHQAAVRGTMSSGKIIAAWTEEATRRSHITIHPAVVTIMALLREDG